MTANLAALIVPRSRDCPDRAFLKELIAFRHVPGVKGVVLADASIDYQTIWQLSLLIGAGVSVTRDRSRRGGVELRLRSGSKSDAPITRIEHGLIDIIAHTHPGGTKLPGFRDIRNLNRLFLHRLRENPYATAPSSVVVWGPGAEDHTVFWPSVLR
jgi:hypothetical protein